MASGAEVRVVAAIRVPLLRRSPPHLEQIPLSLFDVWFLPQPPIQRLFLYDDDGGGGGADDYFPSLVESLRSSLADAVAVFFPLAGKLTYVPSTGDVVVDCSPSAVGDGVAFLEAESDGDVRALSAAERHDVPAFLRLVPSLEAPELPAPVLAVQVTRFVGGGGRGGVAVGVAVHHAVADGLSFWRFMDAWSAAARGRPSPPAPVFDRSAIVHPMAADVARRILRKVTPELPLLPTANWLRRTWQHHDTTTLELDRHRIADIKNRIAELDYEATTTASPRRRLPSTFVAVSALVWSSVVRAAMSSHSHPADDARARLVFLADCRPRLDPPVDAAYFGNCVRGCVAEAAARDLAADDPRAFDTWLDDVGAMLRRRQPGGSLVVVAVAASPRFEAYAAGDLGWGAPSRVEFVSEGAPDGMVVLTGGRKEASVQVSACLGPEYMEAFRSQVLDW
ncbi:malonyl-coenzyme:anthocyanin 5-O-glucoside-6'''-O-malonyltransferase-like [Oryza glaberrima]|uniref:malonyl-coenzyme:anthocyanin 5-O-glucoside-6'''-O-malonyltransferase-like n=1 Tax=Oryza glaberrima TaxID=4538 RepID=UPI00224C62D7|nr:malonyl-coenzyme:anthocyanin 5-O-glucoside-6'''-O-malonyltransferase-like [Oryza glaberrima]